MARNKTVKPNKAENITIQNQCADAAETVSSNFEVVEIANEKMLHDKIRARKYFETLAEKIIKEYDITYQTTPKDPDKIYPKLDVFGWYRLLSYIQLDIEKNQLIVKPGFTYSGINGKDKYIYYNTMCLVDVYINLCAKYGMIPQSNDFLTMTGINDRGVFFRWASTTGENIIKIIDEIGKKSFVSTFINSKVPIERIYTANNLYQLDNTPIKQEVATLDTLPDLLQLTGKNENVPMFGTIQDTTESPENP